MTQSAFIYAVNDGTEYDDASARSGKRLVHDTRMEIRTHPGHGVDVGMIFPNEDGVYDPKLIKNTDEQGSNLPKAVWGTYSRDGLNRMIRELRQARDKAYGKDE